jgi:hypothetical protein
VNKTTTDSISQLVVGRSGSPSVLYYLGTRPSYRLELGEDGGALQFGLGPGLLGITSGNDKLMGFALSPAVHYVRVTDAGFGYGFGLRAMIPFRSCSLASQGVYDYTACANGNPFMLMLEMPIGWNW